MRQEGTHLVVILADGAGGTGGGAVAAQAVVEGAMPGAGAEDLIRVVDRQLAVQGDGQSTAVIVVLSAHDVRGASVGDSGAWIVRGAAVEDLTAGQSRKPLLGSGQAVPAAFGVGPLRGGTLVVASDGLFKYARRSDIARVAGQADLAAAASQLVESVTLRSGEVQDDVAVVLCREVSASPVL